MTNHDDSNKLVDLGAEITGSLASTVVGFLLAGPPGAVGGAVAGPMVTALAKQSTDFLCRSMSHRELVRVGAGFTFAVNRVWERIAAGEQPRHDFFQSPSSGRSPADEILEGMLLKCKNEHEEKKARFMGNIFANAAFEIVSTATVNDILRVAERMSYRQMCLTSCYGRDDIDVKLKFTSELAVEVAKVDPKELAFIHQALVDLSDVMGIIGYTHGQDFLEVQSSPAPPEPGKLTPFGQTCFDLMGLGELPLRDIYNALGVPTADRTIA